MPATCTLCTEINEPVISVPPVFFLSFSSMNIPYPLVNLKALFRFDETKLNSTLETLRIPPHPPASPRLPLHLIF